jgi:TrwC relaxase
MLSTKAQTNLRNAKSYFEEHLATGDYYTESERISGEWLGTGAEMLVLNGVVEQEDFVTLCDNAHPVTNQRLTQRQNQTRTKNAGSDDEREAANRRVFFDFTFSPTKIRVHHRTRLRRSARHACASRRNKDRCARTGTLCGAVCRRL